VRIFGVLSGLEVGDRHKGFRESGMLIFVSLDPPLLIAVKAWLYVDLLPDDLIHLFDGRFRFGTRLVLVAVFNC
jgi:hypothetical protein